MDIAKVYMVRLFPVVLKGINSTSLRPRQVESLP